MAKKNTGPAASSKSATVFDSPTSANQRPSVQVLANALKAGLSPKVFVFAIPFLLPAAFFSGRVQQLLPTPLQSYLFPLKNSYSPPIYASQQSVPETCDTHKYSTEIVSLDPLVIYINNFTSAQEAEDLITLGYEYLPRIFPTACLLLRHFLASLLTPHIVNKTSKTPLYLARPATPKSEAEHLNPHPSSLMSHLYNAFWRERVHSWDLCCNLTSLFPCPNSFATTRIRSTIYTQTSGHNTKS